MISRLTFAQVSTVGRSRAFCRCLHIHANSSYPYWVHSGYSLSFADPNASFNGKARALAIAIFRLYPLGVRIRCISSKGYRIEAPRRIPEAGREDAGCGESAAHLQGEPEAIVLSGRIYRSGA